MKELKKSIPLTNDDKIDNAIKELAAARMQLNGINTVGIEIIKDQITTLWTALIKYQERLT